MTDRSAWFRIREEMFEQLLNEVKERLGPEGRELGAYRRSYEADLDRPWRASSREDLLASLENHRLILLGDFHALQQSQKTHVRLLEALQIRGAGPFVLGLECVPAVAQAALDRFLEGRLSEREFLRRAQWEQWGFPWEHYAPLFQWARRTKTAVLALDDRGSKMKVRDRRAARRIHQVLKERPDHRVVVIFGDLHLASDRLPAELRALGADVPLRVFQNSEKVAMRLLKKGLDHKVDVVRYDRLTFSVQNVPPWVKWQNYLLWLDQNADRELDQDETPDLTDPVAGMVRWLARELGVSIDLGALTVYSADDPDLWSRVKKASGPGEKSWIEIMIEDGRSFYLSAGHWGYLARPSVNHASALAMQFIHDRLCGGAHLAFRMPEDFQKMIWIEGVAYFGSKIINPKRKADTLSDIRASLSSRQGDDRGREALRLALSQKMTEMMALANGAPRSTELRPRTKSSWIAAAHLLGGLMGERLYHGYRRRALSATTIRHLLSKPLDHPNFSMIYQEMLEIVESSPAPTKSKRERL